MKAIAFFDPRTNNGISGMISFTQISPMHPVELFFSLQGFEPFNVHAIHIHEYGDLTDGCKSLGGHYNPTQQKHFHSGLGHVGDLFNNFQTDVKGNFIYCLKTTRFQLSEILGRSIVIHKFTDDLGLQGRFDDKGMFMSYSEMSEQQLRQICKNLGYPTENVRAMIKRLNEESTTTGNASTRIACAIIGWSAQDV